jgi:TatD DNase family protein
MHHQIARFSLVGMDAALALVDSHVHLNFDRFGEDLSAVAQRWRDAGVEQLVHSCCDPAEFSQLQAIADRYPEVFLSVGLHPLDVQQWQPEMEGTIEGYARADRRVVAIGETGLDFFKSDHLDQQREAFSRHIAIAQRLDLPIIVHCRDAAIAAREMLEAAGDVRGVMHCWSGTPEETRWFVDLGFYISFSGIVTFKNADTIRASVAEVPGDRLLIETDCPFLAPVPYRGKRNEPAYVARVAAELAALRGLPVATLATQTSTNARQLFRLPIPDSALAEGIAPA